MPEIPHIPVLRLRSGREKSVLRKHPWIFSGAIQDIEGDPKQGGLVLVKTGNDQLIGYGAFSPNSQIQCRMWEFTDQTPKDFDQSFDILLADRIKSSIQRRISDYKLNNSDAFRLIHAESDQLPGLIVDQYKDNVVIQFLSAGPEKFRDTIIQQIKRLLNPNVIYERSDAEVRQLEGLESREGFLYGKTEPIIVDIEENGLKFRIDIQKGHKTGYYLDQRENRKLLREFCNERDVLDCFSYTGGFTVNAIHGRASTVTAIDTASDALSTLEENLTLNNLDPSGLKIIQNDVFKQLRLFRDQGQTFDVIVLDPPKFAPTRKHAERAARGYKDINLLASKLLRPGGKLFTFSCSGGIDQHLFQQIVAGAALDANVDLQIIGKLTQASDHPILLSFPESNYLKGLICQRIK